MLIVLKAAPVVQTAPIATHFQQPHKHFSDGGPPRPQSTKKNWTRAARRNFQQNMTTSGRPARERERRGEHTCKGSESFNGIYSRRRRNAYLPSATIAIRLVMELRLRRRGERALRRRSGWKSWSWHPPLKAPLPNAQRALWNPCSVRAKKCPSRRSYNCNGETQVGGTAVRFQLLEAVWATCDN